VVEQNRFGTIVPGPDEEPASSSAQPPYPPSPYSQPAAPQPGYAYPPPSYPPPSYPPPSSARTGRIVGIGAAILVTLVVGVAIAVPVFQEQQAKAAAARTTFTMPMAIAGMNRMSGAADSMVQSEVADLPAGIGTPLGAAYGSAGTVSVIVLGGVHAMTSKGQRDFFTGFRRSVQAQGYQLASVSPGVLGGRMECGSTADGTRTICGFTDSGALGAVVVGGSGDAARQMALVVRSAVEHRS
jgi:hypothetical protein